MRKIILAFLTIWMVTGIPICLASDANDWEANLTVSSGNAKNRLSFGQKPAATDFRDGFYDAPAMLGGKLQAYFLDDEGALWRDIRQTGTSQEWQLSISSRTDLPVTISWESALLPEIGFMEMLDESDGNVIDMQTTSKYTLSNTADHEITIKYSHYE